MSNEINDIKNYSAEDIRRYWNNQMSPAEMHALEKAAMDDPFLADALEGYSKLKEDPSEDIAILGKRLAARSKGAAVVPIKRNYWWRVAALILLIGGLGTLTLLLTQNEKSSLSSLQKSEATKDSAKTEVTASQAEDATNQQAPPASESQAYKSSSPEKSANASVRQSPVPKEGAVTTPTSDTSFASDLKRSTEEGKFDKSVAIAPAASGVGVNRSRGDSIAGKQYRDNETLKNNTPQGNYLNYFSGKVVDGQNRSIPFATVRMTNANQVAAADQYGNFQFKSRDSIAEISVSSAGYRERNIIMNSNQEALSITLHPLNEKGKLSEVTAKSTRKKSEDKSDADLLVYVMDAEPIVGWDKYNLYLDSNKKIPTSEPRISGEVVVSFKVNQKGELSSFDVEKSLRKAYDNEAIRLIKEGPGWRVIKGKKPKVKVIVKF